MKKRSVKVSGHPTSISLEEEFWAALKEIAKARQKSMNRLISEVDEGRGSSNLSSALRVYVLEHLISTGKGQ